MDIRGRRSESASPPAETRRLRAAFRAWWDGAASCCALPVDVRDARRGLRLRIHTGRAVIEAFVGGGNAHVAAMNDSECWDLLFDVDVCPVETPGGWTCALCAEADTAGGARTFVSREDLWADHLFEPLLGWIDKKLAPATTIAFFRIEGGGATWARLAVEGESVEGAAAVAPLR